jgi:DNA-binding CsgD family transcriptional regulator
VERLGASDLDAVLARIGELQRAEAAGEFTETLLAAVRSLISCDVVGWNEFDLRTGDFRTRGYPEGYLTEKRLETLDGENPILTHVTRERRREALTMSDFLDERAFRDSPLYTEYFRDLGVLDQMSVFLDVGDPMVTLALNRYRRGFSERDRAVLSVLGAHAATAYAALRERLWLRRRVRMLTGEADGEFASFRSGARALGLTERQIDILVLAARALTNREIAERLVVSPRTIDKHFENIFDRLGVRTRTAAIDRAFAPGQRL